jgi:hypothetical protein
VTNPVAAAAAEDPPQRDHLTIEDLVARAGGTSMQRSLSEGAGILN